MHGLLNAHLSKYQTASLALHSSTTLATKQLQITSICWRPRMVKQVAWKFAEISIYSHDKHFCRLFLFQLAGEYISTSLIFVLFCSATFLCYRLMLINQSRIFLRPLQLQPFSPPPLSATSSALKMFISLSLNISRTDSFFINITPSTDWYAGQAAINQSVKSRRWNSP